MTNHYSNFPCPCCGFLTLDEPISWEICPLCGWEDDPVQLNFPDLAGGANKQSLWEAQIWALKKFPLIKTSVGDFKRARGWRPLTENDLTARADTPQSGLEYFEASVDASKYYWEK